MTKYFHTYTQFSRMGTLQPLVVFLRQEVHGMQNILDTVLSTLQDMRLASSGALLPNEATKETTQSLSCSKMPDSWIRISWAASSVTAWIMVRDFGLLHAACSQPVQCLTVSFACSNAWWTYKHTSSILPHAWNILMLVPTPEGLLSLACCHLRKAACCHCCHLGPCAEGYVAICWH